jgi:hypothetical protein
MGFALQQAAVEISIAIYWRRWRELANHPISILGDPTQRDEHEAAFENQRSACRRLVCAGDDRDGNARGGKPRRILPHRRDFQHARLQLYKPGAVPGGVGGSRRQLLPRSIPAHRQRRLGLSAQAAAFERREEADWGSIEFQVVRETRLVGLTAGSTDAESITGPARPHIGCAGHDQQKSQHTAGDGSVAPRVVVMPAVTSLLLFPE